MAQLIDVLISARYPVQDDATPEQAQALVKSLVSCGLEDGGAELRELRFGNMEREYPTVIVARSIEVGRLAARHMGLERREVRLVGHADALLGMPRQTPVIVVEGWEDTRPKSECTRINHALASFTYMGGEVRTATMEELEDEAKAARAND